MSEINKIGVYWTDARSYNKGETLGLSRAYTEGSLVVENADFVLIENPETILVNENGTRNHPQEKARYYYIPKRLITDMIRYTS